MANKGNNALDLLLNYDSASDNDSGYTSEEERKRKHTFFNPREKKSKKLKINTSAEEDMLVDSESFNWFGNKEDSKNCDQASFFGASSSFFAETTKINSTKSDEPTAGGDLMPCTDEDSQQESKRLIPLPKELNVACECNSDPSEHQGRLRSFPHERGNWASIIYIPITFGVFNPHLNSLLVVLIATCSDNELEIFRCQDYHISLSRTFVLRLEWIQPLVQDFKTRLFNVKKFSMWLYSLAVFCNEEETRTFLVLKVGHGKNEMKEISALADESLKKYKLPPFYDEGSFHVSLAWCHGNKTEPLRKLLPLLQNVCNQYFDLESDMRTFDVAQVHVKTGNRVHNLPLDHT